VRITSNAAELADNASLLIFTMGREYLGSVMDRLSVVLDGAHFLVHAVHALEGAELQRASEIIRAHSAVKQVGAMAGPAHVNELLSGKPNAAVVGTSFPAVARAVRDALESPSFRIHEDPDMRGVELAAALGQVVALAVGLVDGAELGAAAHATVLTRGLREITALGVQRGATEHPFFGLAGVGRLVDALRRGEPNYQVGLEIGRGRPPEECISKWAGEALGVRVAWHVLEYAEKNSLSVPICEAVSRVLDGDCDVERAFDEALARDRLVRQDSTSARNRIGVRAPAR
jgi:glycerol-3-phosphate dehydrogenase (NAD(P)+)